MNSKRNANPTKGRGITVGFIRATSRKSHDEESGAFVCAKSHRHVTPPLAGAVNGSENPRGSFNTRIPVLILVPLLHLLPLTASISSGGGCELENVCTKPLRRAALTAARHVLGTDQSCNKLLRQRGQPAQTILQPVPSQGETFRKAALTFVREIPKEFAILSASFVKPRTDWEIVVSVRLIRSTRSM